MGVGTGMTFFFNIKIGVFEFEFEGCEYATSRVIAIRATIPAIITIVDISEVRRIFRVVLVCFV